MPRKKEMTPRNAASRRRASEANNQKVRFLQRHMLNGKPYDKGTIRSFDKWIVRTLVARGVAELVEDVVPAPPSRKRGDGSILVHELAKELQVKSTELAEWATGNLGSEFSPASKLTGEQADAARAAVSEARKGGEE